jgi:hypothetical protein
LISELGYKSSGIRSPMIIGWLFLEHSHQHKLWRVILNIIIQQMHYNRYTDDNIEHEH